MERVKYCCKKCGYSCKLTAKDYIAMSIQSFFIFIGMFAIILSVFSLITNKVSLLDSVNAIASNQFTTFAKEHDDEIRDVAINLTYLCSGDYSECYVSQVYQKLRSLRYVPVSKYKIIYHPIYTYNNGGDCKNTATLVIALMNSLGFDGEVVCSTQEKHCVSKVPLKYSWSSRDDYSKYAVVDLAMGYFVILNSTQDVWEYDDE